MRRTEPWRSTTCAVASVEPSSTTITSPSRGCADSTRSKPPIIGSSLKAQMTQEIFAKQSTIRSSLKSRRNMAERLSVVAINCAVRQKLSFAVACRGDSLSSRAGPKDKPMIWGRGIAVAIAIIVVCLVALGFARDFLVDWAWFSSIGFAQVFWTIVAAKCALFGAVFVATAAILWVNG